GLMPTTPSCNAAYYGPLDNGAVSIASWIANPVNIQNMLNTTCSASGFAITDVNQMAQCTQLIQGYLTQLTGGNVNLDPTQIMQQIYTAEQLSQAAEQNGALQTQSFYQGLNSITQETSLNEWIPIMRAVITAIAIGILPFLLIFLPSTLGFKAVSAAMGMFVWITVWG